MVLSEGRAGGWDDKARLKAGLDFGVGYRIPQEPSGVAQQSTTAFERVYLNAGMVKDISFAKFSWDLLSLDMDVDSSESFYTRNEAYGGISWEGFEAYMGVVPFPLFEVVNNYWISGQVLDGFSLLSQRADFIGARDRGVGITYQVDRFEGALHVTNGEGGLRTESGVFKDFNIYLSFNQKKEQDPFEDDGNTWAPIAFLEGSFGNYDQVAVSNNSRSRTTLGLGYKWKTVRILAVGSQTEESVDGWNLWKSDSLDLSSLGGEKKQ